eukprot:TRINITY_DN1192_c0_g1_i3.p1 TRINITY_DN1192_c0_g1~~TRINITY_DN1192_c0_g1_i3.p1  ORF type:complete len:517 (+),score=103.38 TRINITY_DN1192_c0_g1_i3:1434-2984(+)
MRSVSTIANYNVKNKTRYKNQMMRVLARVLSVSYPLPLPLPFYLSIVCLQFNRWDKMLSVAFLLLCVSASFAAEFEPQANMIPPFRISYNYFSTFQVICRHCAAVPSTDRLQVQLTVNQQTQPLLSTIIHSSLSTFSSPTPAYRFPIWFNGSMGVDISGDIDLHVVIVDLDQRSLTWKTTIPYQVVKSGTNSTRLLDGAWLDILHWSEDEGQQFNNQLRQMTNEDWRKQIHFMSEIGIRTAIIQSAFLNNLYVKHHTQTCTNFLGENFYPSKLFPKAYQQFQDKADKIEAILTGADEAGVSVFMPISLYAWFDFTPDSLCWHLKEAQELWNMYGHHKSFYGWYIGEEMDGSFFEGSTYYYPTIVTDMITFFQSFRNFSYSISPLMPVMLACNSVQFKQHATQWKQILQYVDIISPFGFARHDPYFSTVPEVLSVVKQTPARLWVDLEIFQYPFPKGLVPKTIDDLIKEIDSYQIIENLVGYEFTGLMDSPQSRLKLGGDAAVKLFEGYKTYYGQRH